MILYILVDENSEIVDASSYPYPKGYSKTFSDGYSIEVKETKIELTQEQIKTIQKVFKN